MTAVVQDGRAPIEAHRVLGDGSTIALVRDDAEIDWWCAPLPHDDPLLWSLLDPAGGRARFDAAVVADDAVEPTAPDAPIAGPVLRTVLRTGDASILVRDALLPSGGGGSTLVRVVEALDRPTTVDHLLRVGGFDRATPAWDGPTIAIGPLRWQLHAIGAATAGHHDDLVTTMALGPDAPPAVLLLTADPSFDVRLDNVLARVDEATERQRLRLARCATSPVLPQRQRDGLAVLHACSHARTGAVVAAPTTSLPEAIGADRQFDYRYSWLRDGSLAAAVAAVVGEGDAAGGALDFLTALGPERLLEAPVWDVEGRPVPIEREVAGVTGYADSRPVRVGNDASHQVQYDALGFVAEAIDIVVREGGELTPERWELARAVAERAAHGGQRPTSGIWEMRDPQPFVDADIGRWMALDHAIRLGDGHLLEVPAAWRSARHAAGARVRSAVTADGLLPQVHPGAGDRPPRPDAAGLLAITCGLFEPDDPLAGRIIDTCIERLGTGPFLHRYPPDATDGFHGVEGAFIPASFWLVTALATVGRIDEATDRLRALDAALPRLLPEEWDVAGARALGNIPLVWSHTEVIRALYAIETATAR